MIITQLLKSNLKTLPQVKVNNINRPLFVNAKFIFSKGTSRKMQIDFNFLEKSIQNNVSWFGVYEAKDV